VWATDPSASEFCPRPEFGAEAVLIASAKATRARDSKISSKILPK
jgi:hypothetical protein